MWLRWRRTSGLTVLAVAGVMGTLAGAVPAGAQVREAGAQVRAVGAQVRAGTASGWAQWGGNPAQNSDDPGERSLTTANVGQLSLAWATPLPDSYQDQIADVAVTGGVAYSAAGDVVTALDADTGAQLWQVTLPGETSGPPSVSDGRVLMNYNDVVRRRHRLVYKGFITGLNSATGARVWSRQIGDLLLGPILVAGDLGYATANGTQIEAFHVSTGQEVWTSPSLTGCAGAQPLDPPLALSDGYLAVAFGQYLYGLNAASGAEIWADTLTSVCAGGGGPPGSTYAPVISQGTIYVGAYDGGLWAINLATGAVEWNDFPDSPESGPVAVDQSDVLFVGLDAAVKSDGTIAWSNGIGEDGVNVFGSLIWGAQSGSEGDRAVAFSERTGDQVYATPWFTYADAGSSPFAPVVTSGRLYLDIGSELVCLALPSG
jgi:outer membrane protein assembly factor BamB